jgi:hypothetical protein
MVTKLLQLLLLSTSTLWFAQNIINHQFFTKDTMNHLVEPKAAAITDAKPPFLVLLLHPPSTAADI